MDKQILTPEWTTALTFEVDETARLLAHGIEILRDQRYTRGTAPSFFACLALGSEKLLKMTFGLLELEEAKAWPPQKIMQGHYSHKIYELDAACRVRLANRLHLSSNGQEVADLLSKLHDDLVVKVFLGALQTYAKGGRFYNLDMLASKAQPVKSPVELWDTFENRLAKADPSIARDINSDEYQDRGQRRLNLRVASHLEDWVRLYFEAWATGMVGTLAQTWGSFHLRSAWDHARET